MNAVPDSNTLFIQLQLLFLIAHCTKEREREEKSKNKNNPIRRLYGCVVISQEGKTYKGTSLRASFGLQLGTVKFPSLGQHFYGTCPPVTWAGGTVAKLEVVGVSRERDVGARLGNVVTDRR